MAPRVGRFMMNATGNPLDSLYDVARNSAAAGSDTNVVEETEWQ